MSVVYGHVAQKCVLAIVCRYGHKYVMPATSRQSHIILIALWTRLIYFLQTLL